MSSDTYHGWVRWIAKDKYRDKIYNTWHLMGSTVGPDKRKNCPDSGVDVCTCWTAVS